VESFCKNENITVDEYKESKDMKGAPKLPGMLPGRKQIDISDVEDKIEKLNE
jgi:hypothetical protein